MKPLNSAIIGVSGYGEVHYSMMLNQVERGDMRVVAAAIINQDEEGKKCARLKALGARIYSNYEAMLECHGNNLDLCFIPTGIHLHALMSIAAMRAGCDVYVEKPAAATIDEVLAMRECEHGTGRFTAVGYQTMYAPETMMIKARIHEYVGKILAVKHCHCGMRADSYYRRNNWAGRMKTNGRWTLDSPFNNPGAHMLNLMCFLAGEERMESARIRAVHAELYRGNDIEGPDTGCLKITTEDDAVIWQFLTTCCEEKKNMSLIVRGERGILTWNDGVPFFTDREGNVKRTDIPEITVPPPDVIMEKLRHRADDRKTFICGLDIAGVQTLCVNGAHESSPVHPVDPQYLSRLPWHGSVRTSIRGIDEVIDRGFCEEKLFSEVGAAWAREGKEFCMKGYRSFSGRNCR